MIIFDKTTNDSYIDFRMLCMRLVKKINQLYVKPVDQVKDENSPLEFAGDKVNEVTINNIRMNKFRIFV